MTDISANQRGTQADSHTHDQETHRTGYVYSIRVASRPHPPSHMGGRVGRERNPDLRLDAASIKKALDARLEASPERYQRGKVLEVAVVMIGGW